MMGMSNPEDLKGLDAFIYWLGCTVWLLGIASLLFGLWYWSTGLVCK